ncbi:MAG: redoxin family protein [candidate division Zixibacteria bacterium]|nr:redoxin family protein [candidate division Zixibacteria bacterium]MDH3937833.1 redoxin family protein [candidate division Zixibacteria bacterium]MDH4035262.1 redoxin family protein [candidate division Zixibacteria bacterium]
MGETKAGKSILKWVGIFVIMTAGVFTGMTLSIKYTGAGSRGAEVLPASLRNSTNLEIGQTMPSITAYHQDGEPMDLQSVLVGRKTVLGFVSQTCGPCKQFIKFLEGSELLASEGYQILLLSVKPEDDLANYVLPVFRVSEELQKELAIDMVPTMIGIGEDATIQFVSCGFSGIITDEYVEEYL